MRFRAEEVMHVHLSVSEVCLVVIAICSVVFLIAGMNVI